MIATDPLEEIELTATGCAPTCGYVLTARAGPRRWLLGSARPRFDSHRTVAYAPDGESIFFAFDRAIVQLDREGRQLSAHALGRPRPQVALADGGSRAASLSGSTLTVFELPSMRELLTVEAPRGLLCLEADGSVVAVGSALWRVDDGARLPDATDPRRFWPTPLRASVPLSGQLVAIAPGGRRALVERCPGWREVDPRSGEGREVGPAPAPAIDKIVWDTSRPAALLMRRDGDLRLWDVARWRTERVLDPERVLVPRPRGGTAQPVMSRATASISADGNSIVVVCGSAVHLLLRDGTLAWRHSLEPDPRWGSGWSWSTGTARVCGDRVVCATSWARVTTESDFTAHVEVESREWAFARGSGSVLELGEPPPRTATLPPQRFVTVWGEDRHLRVDGEILEVPPWFGDLTAFGASPGEHTLLVATSAGLLLRFERVA